MPKAKSKRSDNTKKEAFGRKAPRRKSPPPPQDGIYCPCCNKYLGHNPIHRLRQHLRKLHEPEWKDWWTHYPHQPFGIFRVVLRKKGRNSFFDYVLPRHPSRTTDPEAHPESPSDNESDPGVQNQCHEESTDLSTASSDVTTSSSDPPSNPPSSSDDAPSSDEDACKRADLKGSNLASSRAFVAGSVPLTQPLTPNTLQKHTTSSSDAKLRHRRPATRLNKHLESLPGSRERRLTGKQVKQEMDLRERYQKVYDAADLEGVLGIVKDPVAINPFNNEEEDSIGGGPKLKEGVMIPNVSTTLSFAVSHHSPHAKHKATPKCLVPGSQEDTERQPRILKKEASPSILILAQLASLAPSTEVIFFDFLGHGKHNMAGVSAKSIELRLAEITIARFAIFQIKVAIVGSSFGRDVILNRVLRSDWLIEDTTKKLKTPSIFVENFGRDPLLGIDGSDILIYFHGHTCGLDFADKIPRANSLEHAGSSICVWRQTEYFFDKANKGMTAADLLASLPNFANNPDPLPFDLGRSREKGGVIVNFQSGGGDFAIQIARARGAEKRGVELGKANFTLSQISEVVLKKIKAVVPNCEEIAETGESVLAALLSHWRSTLDVHACARYEKTLNESEDLSDEEVGALQLLLDSASSSPNYIKTFKKHGISLSSPTKFQEAAVKKVEACRKTHSTINEVVRQAVKAASLDALHLWTPHEDLKIDSEVTINPLRKDTGFWLSEFVKRSDSTSGVRKNSLIKPMNNTCDTCEEEGHNCFILYEDAVEWGYVEEEVAEKVLREVAKRRREKVEKQNEPPKKTKKRANRPSRAKKEVPLKGKGKGRER